MAPELEIMKIFNQDINGKSYIAVLLDTPKQIFFTERIYNFWLDKDDEEVESLDYIHFRDTKQIRNFVKGKSAFLENGSLVCLTPEE